MADGNPEQVASREYRIGLLMNFHALRLKDGLRRFIL
jgi:hypothetical protein